MIVAFRSAKVALLSRSERRLCVSSCLAAPKCRTKNNPGTVPLRNRQVVSRLPLSIGRPDGCPKAAWDRRLSGPEERLRSLAEMHAKGSGANSSGLRWWSNRKRRCRNSCEFRYSERPTRPSPRTRSRHGAGSALPIRNASRQRILPAAQRENWISAKTLPIIRIAQVVRLRSGSGSTWSHRGTAVDSR